MCVHVNVYMYICDVCAYTIGFQEVLSQQSSRVTELEQELEVRCEKITCTCT